MPAETTHSPNAKDVRVLIADDQPIFRYGLRRVLETDPTVSVVGEAAASDNVVPLARALQPDVLLLDFTMRIDGLDMIRELSTLVPPVRTLLLAESAEKHEIVEALQLGAHGVILKQSAMEQLLKSIHTLMAGQYWVARESIVDLVTTLRLAGRQGRFGLTDRQMEIVSTVVAGYANKEIAREFSIAEKTVKHHLTNIFDKLGVSSRLELALFAIHHDLTSSGVPSRVRPHA